MTTAWLCDSRWPKLARKVSHEDVKPSIVLITCITCCLVRYRCFRLHRKKIKNTNKELSKHWVRNALCFGRSIWVSTPSPNSEHAGALAAQMNFPTRVRTSPPTLELTQLLNEFVFLKCFYVYTTFMDVSKACSVVFCTDTEYEHLILLRIHF